MQITIKDRYGLQHCVRGKDTAYKPIGVKRDLKPMLNEAHRAYPPHPYAKKKKIFVPNQLH